MQFTGVEAYVAGATAAPNLAGLGLVLPVANLRRAAAYAGWPSVSALEAPMPPELDRLRSRPDVGETLAGVARFLGQDVLPATASPGLIRGLKTAVALLATTAARARGEAVVDQGLAAERAGLVELLAAAGVDVSAGLEAAAAQVERDEAYAGLRDPVRRHLLRDLMARFALLAPLRELYGDAVSAPEAEQGQ